MITEKEFLKLFGILSLPPFKEDTLVHLTVGELRRICKEINEIQEKSSEIEWNVPSEKLPEVDKGQFSEVTSKDLIFIVKKHKDKLEFCFGCYDTRTGIWYDKTSQDRDGSYYEYLTREVEFWRDLPPLLKLN